MDRDMMSETITITLAEYKLLKSDSRLLSALKGAGVDNWEGYDYAMKMFDEE